MSAFSQTCSWYIYENSSPLPRQHFKRAAVIASSREDLHYDHLRLKTDDCDSWVAGNSCSNTVVSYACKGGMASGTAGTPKTGYADAQITIACPTWESTTFSRLLFIRSEDLA